MNCITKYSHIPYNVLWQWLIDEEQGGAKSRNTVDVLEKTLEINNQVRTVNSMTASL